MTTSIYLMRHGAAESGEGKPDEERHLTPRGELEVRDIGRDMRASGARLDLCLCSPLIRAASTAQLVWQELGTPGPLKQVELLRPGADAKVVLRELLTGVATTLLVAHMPDLGDLARLLLGQAASADCSFVPGAVARIDFAAKPAQGGGQLGWKKKPSV